MSNKKTAITSADGSRVEYNSNGKISQHTEPSGKKTVYTYANDQILKVKTTFNSQVEERHFTYVSDRVTKIIVKSGAALDDVSKLVFVYYGSGSTEKGMEGDLKTLTESTKENGSWVNPRTTYYRYYKTGEANGFVHGLKFKVGPEAYARNSGIESMSDIAGVADVYYEYDSEKRVSKNSTSGAISTAVITYAKNTPTGVRSYDKWTNKCVMKIYDHTGSTQLSTKTIYSNFAGQELLVDYQKNGGSSRHWISHKKYNLKGKLTEEISPAAINTYNSSDDLAVSIKTNAGLINYTLYDTNNLPKEKGVQQGSSGTKIPVTKTLYDAVTYSGVYETTKTLRFVKTQTLFPTASSTGIGTTIETSIDTEYYSTTAQVKKVTVTLPKVPVGESGENGQGTTHDTIQEFNTLGQLTKSTTASGIKTDYTYDANTGAVEQMKVTGTGSGGSLVQTTDYESDAQGRITQTLGPVHQAEGADVRHASWTVYEAEQSSDDWVETRSASGYQTAGGSDILVGSVSVSRQAENGSSSDSYETTPTSFTGPLTASTGLNNQASGKWTSWSKSFYDNKGRVEKSRVYHDIPTSGAGGSTNYAETSYIYDDQGRQKDVTSPNGTITQTVYDNFTGSVKESKVGTSSGLVTVASQEYYSGTGLLKKSIQHIDGSTTRDTLYSYDWRNRQTTTVQVVSGSSGFKSVSTLDNLGRATVSEQYRDATLTSGGTLIGKSETKYDTRGRVYRTLQYKVSNGVSASSPMTSNTTYDCCGNVLKSHPAGSDLYTVTSYDVLKRPIKTTQAYASGSNDVVFEQTETTYNIAGQVLSTKSLARYHDKMPTYVTSTFVLTAGSNARVNQSAMWYDKAGRSLAAATYGNQGNDSPSFTRPSSAPSSSANVLVTSTEYETDGSVKFSIDTAGKKTKSVTDDAGRVTQTISNYVNGSHADADKDVTVTMTYLVGGQLKTLVAKNGSAPDQTTTYTYGVTIGGSELNNKDLLHTTKYPDSSTGSDVVTTEVNRAGQPIKTTDQNGTIHTYVYDTLGRPTEDKVTLAGGSSVDNSVLRIERNYNSRGQLKKITSYDSASGGSIENEVSYTYNSVGQVTAEKQKHDGLTEKTVAYTYDSKHRATSIKYPSTREITYTYTGIDDKLNRLTSIKDGSNTTLASYKYIGLQNVSSTKLDQPSITLDHDLTNDNSYGAVDRFGRVIDLRWKKSTTDLVHITHDYDFAGNRTNRSDVLAASQSPAQHHDELYSYDAVNRLKDFKRGNLAGGSITSKNHSEDWTLDALGNWTTFKYDSDGNGTLDVTQNRTHNKANEITVISNGVDPVHDANGNMTTIPKPANGSLSFTAKYDAWNRLVKLNNGSVGTYRYDGLNRRVSKTTGATTRHYYYSTAWQVIEERVGSSSSPDQQYVWGARFVDDLICRDESLSGGGSTRLFALQDANFNVVALVGKVSTSWVVLERFHYDPYGKTRVLEPDFTSRANSAYNWIYLFTGRELDSESGLQLNRNRYYHNGLGRWINRDPIGYDGGDLNLYAYVGGGPINGLDSLGESKGGKRCVRPSEIPANWTAEQVQEYLKKLIAEGLKKGSKRARNITGWLKVLRRGGCIGIVITIALTPGVAQAAEPDRNRPPNPSHGDEGYDEYIDDIYNSYNRDFHPEGTGQGPKCDCKCRVFISYVNRTQMGGGQLDRESFGEWLPRGRMKVMSCKALQWKAKIVIREPGFFKAGLERWTGFKCKVENCGTDCK